MLQDLLVPRDVRMKMTAKQNHIENGHSLFSENCLQTSSEARQILQDLFPSINNCDGKNENEGTV
jgi:hypothetical protein